MNQLSQNLFSHKASSKTFNSPEIIAVTSGKGGVGKTNLSVNISLSLHQMNKRTMLFDADIHLGNVDLFLGLRPKYSIMDFAVNNVDLNDIIVKDYNGIDILPSSASIHTFIEQEKSIINKLNKAFASLESQYDVFVIDTGAGIGHNVISFLLGADKVVLVVTPDPSSIADAYGVVKIIKSFDYNGPILMVSNMVQSNQEGELLFQKMSLMVRRFLNAQIVFAGSIKKDDLIVDSIRQQRPLVLKHPTSSATKSLKLITHRIIKQPRQLGQGGGNLFKRVRNNQQLLKDSDDYV